VGRIAGACADCGTLCDLLEFAALPALLPCQIALIRGLCARFETKP
jgi:hypothetical protein